MKKTVIMPSEGGDSTGLTLTCETQHKATKMTDADVFQTTPEDNIAAGCN